MLQMQELSDAELVVLARADDTDAFCLLLERYQPLAFAIALHQVPQPEMADEYRGKRVRLSAEIKTVDVAQQAGLYLRIVDQGRTRANEEREQVALQGTQAWAYVDTQIEVPADGVFVLFGISLTGKGQVWMKDVKLEVM